MNTSVAFSICYWHSWLKISEWRFLKFRQLFDRRRCLLYVERRHLYHHNWLNVHVRAVVRKKSLTDWSMSSWKIRIADTVGLKIVYGQFLKVPPTEILTPRARLSEVWSPSCRNVLLHEPRSWISMAPRRWNTPGVPKPYSSLPHLSETNLRSWRFHPADRPDSQARHYHLVKSARVTVLIVWRTHRCI